MVGFMLTTEFLDNWLNIILDASVRMLLDENKIWSRDGGKQLPRMQHIGAKTQEPDSLYFYFHCHVKAAVLDVWIHLSRIKSWIVTPDPEDIFKSSIIQSHYTYEPVEGPQILLQTDLNSR